MAFVYALTVMAVMFNILGFWFYNRDAFLRGGTRPNGASSFLWAINTLVNAGSYYGMHVPWPTLAVIATDTTLCVVTFAFLLFAERFGRLTGKNYFVAFLCIVAIFLWKFRSAEDGNLLAQVPMILSFVPLMQDARAGKTKEDPRAWLSWIISFIFNFFIVCLTSKDRIQPFAYPIVAIVMHGILFHYAQEQRRFGVKDFLKI